MRAVTRGKKNPGHQTLAQRLKRTRKAAKLTRAALEKMACISGGMVHGIEEKRRRCGADIAEYLALVLGLSPCQLAFGAPTEFTADAPQAHGIGPRLRQAREALGMTKKAVGEASGVTGQTIANIEGGVIPQLDVTERLAGVLRVSVCWLAFNEGPRELPARVRRARATNSP